MALNNGEGLITVKKDPQSCNTQVWTGSLIHRGRRLLIQGFAHLGVKYEFEVKQPPRKEGENWVNVTRFEMPPFGDLNVQDVNIPRLGRFRVHRGPGYVQLQQLAM